MRKFMDRTSTVSKLFKFQVRNLAREAEKQTMIPPPPPDPASDRARIGILGFAVVLATYIAIMPENNYDSIGLMGPPGKVPPPKEA